MTRRKVTFTGLAALMITLCVSPAIAQQKPRVSPPGTASATIGGQSITITYHRPYAKGRQILGNLIPFGKVWRLGANEATKLTTPVDIEINGLKVPAGSYSMFMLIDEEEPPRLIVNKVADQWGAFKYDASQDVGRVVIDGEQGHPHVEQFTITLESTGDNTGRVTFAWGDGKGWANIRVLN